MLSFLRASHQKPCMFFFFPVHATYPTHTLHNLISQYLVRSTNQEAPHYAIFSVSRYFLSLRPKYSSETLFSNIFMLCSSLHLREEVSHPYKTTGKIKVLYTWTFILLHSNCEHRRFWTKCWQAFPKINLFLISPWTQFWFFSVILKNVFTPTFSGTQLGHKTRAKCN
jgi:hypothetical protein